MTSTNGTTEIQMLNDIVDALRLAKEYAVESWNEMDLATFRDAEKSALVIRTMWGHAEATRSEAVRAAEMAAVIDRDVIVDEERERLATMIEEQATLWNDYAVPRTRVRAVTTLIRGEAWER